MMTNEHSQSLAERLPKHYLPAETEPNRLRDWLDTGAYHSAPSAGRQPFSIVIPPPTSPASSTWATP